MVEKGQGTVTTRIFTCVLGDPKKKTTFICQYCLEAGQPYTSTTLSNESSNLWKRNWIYRCWKSHCFDHFHAIDLMYLSIPMSHIHFIGPWGYYTWHQSRKIRATSSTPRMLLVLACYIECFHSSYLLHTTNVPPVHFTPASPQPFHYLPMILWCFWLLTSSPFLALLCSLCSRAGFLIIPSSSPKPNVEAPKSSRVLEMGNVSGAGRKAPGLQCVVEWRTEDAEVARAKCINWGMVNSCFWFT